MDRVTRFSGDMTENERIMIALVKAAELFKRTSSAIFSDYGLTFPQYNALRILSASEGGRSTMSEVGRRLLSSNPNMSGIAKRLEKSKFIRRNPDPEDERKKTLIITPKGRRVLNDIAQRHNENVGVFLNGFPDKEKALFFEGLRRLLHVG